MRIYSKTLILGKDFRFEFLYIFDSPSSFSFLSFFFFLFIYAPDDKPAMGGP